MLSVESSKMLDPNLNISLEKIPHKIIIFNFNEHKPYFYVFLRLKSWDLLN